jgi:hypothetical protein
MILVILSPWIALCETRNGEWIFYPWGVLGRVSVLSWLFVWTDVSDAMSVIPLVIAR